MYWRQAVPVASETGPFGWLRGEACYERFLSGQYVCASTVLTTFIETF